MFQELFLLQKISVFVTSFRKMEGLFLSLESLIWLNYFLTWNNNLLYFCVCHKVILIKKPDLVDHCIRIFVERWLYIWDGFKTGLHRRTFNFFYSVVHIHCCHSDIPDILTKILCFFNKNDDFILWCFRFIILKCCLCEKES